MFNHIFHYAVLTSEISCSKTYSSLENIFQLYFLPQAHLSLFKCRYTSKIFSKMQRLKYFFGGVRSKRIIGDNWRVLSWESALFCKNYSAFFMKNGLTWHKEGKKEALVVIETVKGHQMRFQISRRVKMERVTSPTGLHNTEDVESWATQNQNGSQISSFKT